MVKPVVDTPPRPNRSIDPLDARRSRNGTAEPGEARPDLEVMCLLLEEQRKTNELLLTLIEALAEDQGVDEDMEPARHLDGTLA